MENWKIVLTKFIKKKKKSNWILCRYKGEKNFEQNKKCQCFFFLYKMGFRNQYLVEIVLM